MWAKVDDQLAFHRKTLRAGNAPMGLWVRAISWLAGQTGRSDPEHRGVITLAELRTMGTQAQINALIDAGFLDRTLLDGQKACRFHDWNEFQPTVEERDAQRQAWAERKARSRAHQAGDHALCKPTSCRDADPEHHREDTTA